jgi:hypothetical protein
MNNTIEVYYWNEKPVEVIRQPSWPPMATRVDEMYDSSVWIFYAEKWNEVDSWDADRFQSSLPKEYRRSPTGRALLALVQGLLMLLVLLVAALGALYILISVLTGNWNRDPDAVPEDARASIDMHQFENSRHKVLITNRKDSWRLTV